MPIKCLVTLVISILLTGCSTLSNNLSEDIQDDYDFRNVRWGYSQERVALNERGRTVFFRTQDLLIYKSVMYDVPVLLVYTFRDNKLRSAGYLTQKPTTNAQNLIKTCIEEHGDPDYDLSDGMMWKLPKSIVYVEGYTSHARARNSVNRQSSGVLEFVLKEQKKDDDLIYRWDGALTYIDINFYKQLAEIDYPLLDLSYYEKRLFGILKRRATLRVRTQTGDTVEIPLNRE